MSQREMAKMVDPICISNPILVKVRFGSMNTAGLLRRRSALSNLYLMRILKSSVDLMPTRSSW